MSATPSAISAGQALDAAVRAVELGKTYGRGPSAVTALDRVTVDLPRGQLTAIMGPSGSGKSTLLHCLAGLEAPDHGTVWLGDTNLSTLGERQLTRLRRDRIGFIFQAYNLLPTLTAERNITLPLALARRDPDPAWIGRVIRTMGLEGHLGHRPAQLSGGQQQRVAAARALAGRPAVIFADEPTGNLDSRSGAALLGLLRDCVERLGQTIVLVTHDPVAAGYADEAVFLADGRIVDRMAAPTAARVLDRMKDLGG
jgi:putative ABC transport system ATP-binding protein